MFYDIAVFASLVLVSADILLIITLHFRMRADICFMFRHVVHLCGAQVGAGRCYLFSLWLAASYCRGISDINLWWVQGHSQLCNNCFCTILQCYKMSFLAKKCERMIMTGTLCMQEYTLLACVLQSKDKEIY